MLVYTKSLKNNGSRRLTIEKERSLDILIPLEIAYYMIWIESNHAHNCN